MKHLSHAEIQNIVGVAFNRDLGLDGVIPLGGGQINATSMLVLDNGDRYVLRVAPDAETAEAGPSWLTPYGLRREAAAIATLPDLAELLPVTIAADFEHAVIERDWVVQQAMPGVPLDSIDAMLPDEARETIWRETGAFSNAMHRHSAASFGAVAWGSEHQTWPDLVATDVAGCLNDAIRFGLDPTPFGDLLEFVRDRNDLLNEVTVPALIHSDLFASHVFVSDNDEDGSLHLAGVIDLEFARYADPMSEHLLARAASNEGSDLALAAFREGYGELPEGPNSRSRNAIYTALDPAWNLTLAASQSRDTALLMNEFINAVRSIELLR